MHSRFTFPFFLMLLLASGSAFGAPVRVVLFPNSGQVTEQVSLPADQGGRVSFSIPGTADPQTLTLRLLEGTGEIENVSWSRLEREDSEEVRVLLDELDGLKKEQNGLNARLEGARTSATFWKTLAQKGVKETGQVVQLASNMGQELEKSMIRASEVESNLEKLNRKISLLKEKIEALRGRLETMWQVTAELSGNVSAPARLECSYVLTGCGWHSMYRLDARPDTSRIDFTWTARVHQKTGTPWTDVSLALATARPGSAPVPGPIRPWVIAPRPEPVPQAEGLLVRSFEKTLSMAPTPAQMDNAPAPTERGTYALWELGTKTIAAGDPVHLSLTKESWPAHFRYLLRPSRTPLGFLQGEVRLAEPHRIPAGTAMFLVDGAMLDKRMFSLSGKEAEIFFGSDPLVSVETTLKDKKSGERGFFAGRQTYAWAWNMIVTSNKKNPIQVRVEEPKPQTGDERITLELKSVPESEPEKDPKLLAWEFELEPGGKKIIDVEVRAAAPKEMDLMTGGRF